MPNSVYIATSLDGYIADSKGGVAWLQDVPNPEKSDFGFGAFMETIDAVVMGRATFETVLGFDCDWAYAKPVFVLSSTLTTVPDELAGTVEIIQGTPDHVVSALAKRGYTRLYIDGGKTIQGFLRADRIDDLIVSRLPILLGDGIPLFGMLPEPMAFEHVSTEVLAEALVKSHYRRRR